MGLGTLLPLLCNTTLHIIINKFQLTGKSHLFYTIIFRVVFYTTSVCKMRFRSSDKTFLRIRNSPELLI